MKLVPILVFTNLIVAISTIKYLSVKFDCDLYYYLYIFLILIKSIFAIYL